MLQAGLPVPAWTVEGHDAPTASARFVWLPRPCMEIRVSHMHMVQQVLARVLFTLTPCDCLSSQGMPLTPCQCPGTCWPHIPAPSHGHQL